MILFAFYWLFVVVVPLGYIYSLCTTFCEGWMTYEKLIIDVLQNSTSILKYLLKNYEVVLALCY